MHSIDSSVKTLEFSIYIPLMPEGRYREWFHSQEKKFSEKRPFFEAFCSELYVAPRYKEIFETKNIQEQLGDST